MENAELDRLGFSEAPPASSDGRGEVEAPTPGVNKPKHQQPLWIRFPTDSYSTTHKINCQAWAVITNRTSAQVVAFIESLAGTNRQDEMRLAILRCRAWIWLERYSAADIRIALGKMPVAEAGPLRRELNTVRAMIKSHTEGDTYE